jgi:aminopeptidase N
MDGMKYSFHIPNTWFIKQTDAVMLPKWFGWDKIHPEYSCTVVIPGGLKSIQIDPTFRLADIYMPDNYYRHKVEFDFDAGLAQDADWKKYQARWRPDAWYNALDGIKLGLHVNGNYYQVKNNFSLTVWYNSSLFTNGIPDYDLDESLNDSLCPVSFQFHYFSNTHRLLKNSGVQFSLQHTDGLWMGNAQFHFSPSSKNKITLAAKSMLRPGLTDVMYALYPEFWNAGAWNNKISVRYQRNYTWFKGNGTLQLGLFSSSLLSDYSYSYVQGEWLHHHVLSKLDGKSRVIAQFGTGEFAPESMLFLAGANPEELAASRFLRSKAFVPNDWIEFTGDENNFHAGGGLNLRGYSGYLAPETNEEDGMQYLLFSSHSGMALNLEIDFDKFIPLKPTFTAKWLGIDLYLFTDAGLLGYRNSFQNFSLGKVRLDAGTGTAFTIKKWGSFTKAKPLTLRFDFPLFLNSPPAASSYVDFRWVVGLGRSF